MEITNTRNKPIWPILTLLLLAPMSGEILTSSQPPLEFFHVLNIVLQMMMYGCGALLIRELKVRKSLGWLAIFLLGLAYGIYEEGIVVRSFFDPGWVDLGYYSAYGRWIGVNWIWSINLSIFHAVVSIMTPIMLLDVLFPAHQGRSLLRKRGLIVAITAFCLMMPIGLGFETKATAFQLLGCFLLIGILTFIAHQFPVSQPIIQQTWKLHHYFWLPLLASLLYWLFFFFLPNLGVPVLVDWWLCNGLIGFYIYITHHFDRLGNGFTNPIRVRFALGTLLLWFFFDLIAHSMPESAAVDMRGLGLFGSLYLIFLIVLILKNKPQPLTPIVESEPE